MIEFMAGAMTMLCFVAIAIYLFVKGPNVK